MPRHGIVVWHRAHRGRGYRAATFDASDAFRRTDGIYAVHTIVINENPLGCVAGDAQHCYPRASAQILA